MRVDPPTSRNSLISLDLQVGVVQGPLADLQGFFHIGSDQVFEFIAVQMAHQVQRAVGGFGDEGQVDLTLLDSGQFDLGIFCRLADALQCGLVLGKIDVILVGEFLDQFLGQGNVEVVASQVGVAGSGQHLDDAVLHFQNGNVDGAAAEIVDDDLGLFSSGRSNRPAMRRWVR